MPAIYNGNLARYNWNPPEPTPNSDECDRQVVINVKLENENTQLKETIVQLQNRIGAEDLTTNQMADLQETLLADDDDDDESFLWLNGTQANLPGPIGDVKVENESMDTLEMTSSENDELVELDNSDFPPYLTMQQNKSIREPIASTSGIASTSNCQQTTSIVPTMNFSPTSSASCDKVAGSIEFTLDVRIVCLLCLYHSNVIPLYKT